MVKFSKMMLIGVILMLMLNGCGASELEKITVVFTEDKQSVFHNPDMGWVLYDNYLISEKESPASTLSPIQGYDFPGVDYVILKFTWADIEKEADCYDFSKFDEIYDYWTEREKIIMLGMSADSLLWYGTKGTGVPQYVLSELPQESVQTRVYNAGGGSICVYTTCDANEPYYQERLKLFLDAMQSHMKETDREVEYIDLRGYGLWGEWHQGYQYASLEDKRKALDKVMEIWSEAFAECQLAISYSYDPDEPVENYTNSNYYDEYLYWSAYDLAMKYENITLRRDGCGGAIQNNERIFCEEIFADLSRGPFTAEGAGGYSDHDSAKYIIEDGLTLHPNYFTIVGWANKQAKAFIENEAELFDYALINMGYRFVMTNAVYDQTVERQGELMIQSVWKNTAVGRAVRNYVLIAKLTDKNGETTEVPLGVTDCSQWIKGEEYSCNVSGMIPETLTRGEYTLSIAMYDEKTQQYIELAIQEREGEEPWYVLGSIKIR